MMADANRTISIAEDFSPFPAGRVPADGDFNGQAFRERMLSPKLRSAIQADERLIVSLDGLRSCGSSFLESAFGGLIRYDGFKPGQIKRHLGIKHSRPALERYKLAIERYIERAKPGAD